MKVRQLKIFRDDDQADWIYTVGAPFPAYRDITAVIGSISVSSGPEFIITADNEEDQIIVSGFDRFILNCRKHFR
jgi:hypothetical protein